MIPTDYILTIVNAKNCSPSSIWSKPHTYIIYLPFFLTFDLHNYGLPSFSLKKAKKPTKRPKKLTKELKSSQKG